MRLPGTRTSHDEARKLLGADSIAVESVSKCYHVAAERIFETPTPLLTRAFRGRRPRGFDEDVGEDEDDDEVEEVEPVDLPGAEGDVWALRDVSMRVPRGASVGLVGGAGSGKTTLLRVLAGVAPPSSGRAVVAGRTTPLLSHTLQFLLPSYSPLQNVLLYAAVASVPKRAVRARLDEIFSFVEVPRSERKAPVTRGLGALAVASMLNVDADVLLLDDPFAFARGRFRKRALDLIDARRAAGATVLLETADREALRQLCPRAVWFDAGTVVAEGPADEILAAYDADVRRQRVSAPATGDSAPAHGFNETAAIVDVRATIERDRTAVVDVVLEVARPGVLVQVGVGLAEPDGRGRWFEQPEPVRCETPGYHRFRLRTPEAESGSLGLVQVRLLESGSEAVIGRRDGFPSPEGAPEVDIAELADWEPADGEWSKPAT